jgi:hypothetical protein
MKKGEGTPFAKWLGEYYKLNLGGLISFDKLRQGWDDNLTPEEMLKRRIGDVRKEHIK